MTRGPNNPLSGLVGYQLRRASATAMDELAREMSGASLRPTEASVLLLIQANPKIRPSEVGRELGIQRANMTPLVTALERRGLIQREAKDGRSQGLLLTDAGQAACETALGLMRRHEERLLGKLGPQPPNALSELLERLWKAPSS